VKRVFTFCCSYQTTCYSR